jgi:diguanylate cyclase (GGDEF)-like protein
VTGHPPRPEPASDDLGVHSLDPTRLERFLERRRAGHHFSLELSLSENLEAVLRKANEFVPSSAGSILLDDPREKQGERRGTRLTFIAAFGSRSHDLMGTSIPADRGIAGHVYVTGSAYRTADAAGDDHFYPEVDRSTRYTTRSVIAIPIRIEQEVCGVLELINRQHADGFSINDRNLLEIFAGYISISIQNVLDGRQAQEIAKRDNLTGLFNDRFLHIALTNTLRTCRAEGRDLAMLFIDLDFFKRVNDTHGHLAGSQVLREVGALLGRHATARGGIAARYGGDEFVLVVPDMDLAVAVDMAEEIRTEVVATTYCGARGEIQPEPLHLKGLTCSIGVATVERHLTEELGDEEGRSTLLRLADAAMYVAKETGRNRTAVAGEPVRRRRADSGRD